MNVNVFIREIVVHDTRDSGQQAGEYDIVFAAWSGPDPSGAKSSQRWANPVRRAETYEILEWIGPVAVDETGGLIVCGRGREHDLVGHDALLGGIAVFSGGVETGGWWRTTNGPHFDFVFALTPADRGHEARPLFTGQMADAPGPAEPSPDDYPPGLE